MAQTIYVILLETILSQCLNFSNVNLGHYQRSFRRDSTVRRKSIHPFADFSSKMTIFKVSEKYLNDGNSSKFLQFLLLLIGKAFWFGFGAIIFSVSENTSF